MANLVCRKALGIRAGYIQAKATPPREYEIDGIGENALPF
jgi:hypothetical protein